MHKDIQIKSSGCTRSTGEVLDWGWSWENKWYGGGPLAFCSATLFSKATICLGDHTVREKCGEEMLEPIFIRQVHE